MHARFTGGENGLMLSAVRSGTEKYDLIRFRVSLEIAARPIFKGANNLSMH